MHLQEGASPLYSGRDKTMSYFKFLLFNKNLYQQYYFLPLTHFNIVFIDVREVDKILISVWGRNVDRRGEGR